MRRVPAAPLTQYGYGNLVPFLAAAILFAIAVQAKFLSFKPTPIEFPSRIDEITVPGALPQYSVLPDLPAERAIVKTTVLPDEAAPSDLTPSAEAPPPSVALTAPGESAATSEALPGASLPSAMGFPMGARSMHIRTSRSGTALSSLSENLIAQIKRLHALPPQVRVKRPASIVKVVRPGAASPLAEPGRARSPALGVGGPAPLRGVLGGRSPLAANDDAAINGTTFKRRF